MNSSIPPEQGDPAVPPSQQHPAASGPAPAPAPMSSSQRKPWLVPAAIGVLAGLVVGVLVGTFLLGGSGAGGTSGAADAAIACQYVSSVSDEVDPDEPLDLEEPTIWRLQAIGPLAVAAAKADDRYEAFGDHGRDLSSAVARLDTELLISSLDAMAEGCRSF